MLTNDPDGARAKITESLRVYGKLPPYRAMLDKEGVAGPGDIAVVGDDKALDAALDRPRDVGVTDFDATVVPMDEGVEARTLDYLRSRL